MSKVLKKLYLGDVVKSFGTKQLRKLTTEEPVMGGLFDADDNLVASWGTLVNTYGMDVEKDYTSSTYKTDTASPYYVLTNHSELANGSKLVIGGSVTSIGDRAFMYCSSLNDIIIPNSVTSIGDYAFMDCTSLTTVIIGKSVTSIGYGAFADCTSLTHIDIPDSVTSISGFAFYGCTSLTNIGILDSVTSIGQHSFEQCKSLTSIEIPDTVTSIGVNAFKGCTLLTNITLSKSLQAIPNFMFVECKAMRKLTIPISVQSIGYYIFDDCDSRITRTITYEGTMEQWNNISLAENWNAGGSNTKWWYDVYNVICTDGTIKYEGT